jgi:hypothetical protein
VVLTDPDTIFTITYVVASSAYTIGSKSIPANAARLFIEVVWPWQSRSSKLLLHFKLVIGTTITLSIPDASVPSELRLTKAGVVIGSFSSDTFARIAESRFDVLFTAATDTSTTDTSLKAVATDKVYTIAALFDIVGAPTRVVFDPIVASGNSSATVTTTTVSAAYSTSIVSTTSILTLIAAAFLAARRMM